ncbi:MAG TPA: oligosaccharide flippase family protein, partial [Thermoanaerobaculia bacterium]|nr:oligosaccharide flippase family protein [Thermoanaerobaculia bacterium]
MRTNFLANLAGTGWAALLQLVFTPVYVRLLGPEAYGLIGFLVLLQAVLQVFDLGITPTVSRYVAQASVRPESAGDARDLVRTLELAYWAMAVVIGALLFAGAGLLATRWLHGRTLPPQDVREALMAMALVLAVQWPVAFY